MNNCCRARGEGCKPPWRCYESRCLEAACFGLGLAVASFCPKGLALFLCAVILAAMGISLLRHAARR